MTKLFRVVSYVIDREGYTVQDVKEELSRNKYVNPIVKDVRVTDIGEWNDDHPLNRTSATQQDFDRHFPELNLKDNEAINRKLVEQRENLMYHVQRNSELSLQIVVLEKRIKALEKVQEFVDTIKELTRGT